MANEEDRKNERPGDEGDSPDSPLLEEKIDLAATPEVKSTQEQKVNDKPETTEFNDSKAAAGSSIPLKNSNLRRLVAPVIIGLLVVAIIALFARSRSQSKQLTDEVETRQTLEGQINDLENQLTSQIRDTNELADGLKTVRTERDQFQAEATTLKSGQLQLKKQLENTVAFSKTLEERLKAEKEIIDELQTAAKESRQNQKQLYEKLESLLNEKKTLQDELFQAKSGITAGAVNMPGLIVKDRPSAIPSLTGTILKVNQKYDFVVLNRGDSDGVKKGDRFRVMDRNKEIGEVIATRVLPDMTVADIDRQQTHRRLKKGFSVFLHE
jgi:myosin heavy subunit